MERRLAESDSHQFPLNPEVKVTLPPQLEKGRKAKHMQVDFNRAAELWDQTQKFLSDLFARS